MQRATAVTALRPTAVSEGQPANKEACGTIAVGAAYRWWQAAVQVNDIRDEQLRGHFQFTGCYSLHSRPTMYYYTDRTNELCYCATYIKINANRKYTNRSNTIDWGGGKPPTQTPPPL